MGIVRGFVISRATSLAISFSFSTALACCTTLGGLIGEGRALAGTSLLGSNSLGAVLALELEELDTQMDGG